MIHQKVDCRSKTQHLLPSQIKTEIEKILNVDRKGILKQIENGQKCQFGILSEIYLLT